MFKVKICGITNRKDYLTVNRMGADFSGFIFYKESPRYVDMETAARIIQKGKSPSLNVGVFVNEHIKKIRSIFKYAGLDIVQLHGDESPNYCKELGLPYWKVVKVKTIESLNIIKEYPGGEILLDSYVAGQQGGTGIPFSWDILEKALKYKSKLIIAGGISEQNINEIWSKNIYGIDLCSSVERLPGKKDKKKLRSFFDRIKKLKEENCGN
jgi:phosphoribosylanthranilate isomerase